MAPVIDRASSDARNANRAATSSGSAIPRRPPRRRARSGVDVRGELCRGGDVRVRAGGRDRVHPQWCLQELDGQRPSELHHGALAHAVGRRVGEPLQSRVGRDVHDVATGAEQVRDGGLSKKEATVEVHRHDPAVLLERQVRQVRSHVGCPRHCRARRARRTPRCMPRQRPRTPRGHQRQLDGWRRRRR